VNVLGKRAKWRFAAGAVLPGARAAAAALAAAAICAAAPAGAQAGTPAEPPHALTALMETTVYSPRADAVAITIYRDNLALITETRTVDLPDSAVTLVIEGVVETLLPQSAVIADIARPVAEANFDFDRLTPRALLEGSVGESVIVTRTNPATGVATRAAARVVSAGEGVILWLEDGHEALYCSGLPERLEFVRIPDGLRAKPQLSVKLAPGEAGPRTVKVSYLAHGFAWSADYVARLNERSNRMNLSGWATLTNRTGAAFQQAEVQLVAGNLNILAAAGGGSGAQDRDRIAQPEAQGIALLSDCFAADSRAGFFVGNTIADLRGMDPSFGTRTLTLVDGRRMVSTSSQADLEELGDYHLYRIPWRSDLGAHQTKQALFLDKRNVRVERFYSLRRRALTQPANEEVVTPNLVVRWENIERAGLGEPLARGTVRVFEPYGGREVFAGEATIEDRPVGVPVELEIGRALNVMLEVTTGFGRSGTQNRPRTTVAADYRIVNNKSVPIDIEIRHSAESRYRDLQVEESSRQAGRKYGDLAWRFTVRPGEGALRYRLSALELDD
jgi:hypothetical protein